MNTRKTTLITAALAAATLSFAAPRRAQAQNGFNNGFSFTGGGVSVVPLGGYYGGPSFLTGSNYNGFYGGFSSDFYGNSLFTGGSVSQFNGNNASDLQGSGGFIGPDGRAYAGYDANGNPIPANGSNGYDPNDPNAVDPNAPDAGNRNTVYTRPQRSGSGIQVRPSGKNLLFSFNGDATNVNFITVTLLNSKRRPLRSEVISRQNPTARLPHYRNARYYRANVNFANGNSQSATFRL